MIRPANVLDIPAILKLGTVYANTEVTESNHHTAEWDMDAAATALLNTIASQDGYLWVYTSKGEVKGFMWAMAHELAPWSTRKIASDLLLYVVPELRGSSAALKLIYTYREWAKSIGCKEVRLSVASGVNQDRTCGLYKKLGFTLFGEVFNSPL